MRSGENRFNYFLKFIIGLPILTRIVPRHEGSAPRQPVVCVTRVGKSSTGLIGCL